MIKFLFFAFVLTTLGSCSSCSDEKPSSLYASKTIGEKPGWRDLEFVSSLILRGMIGETVGLVLLQKKDTCLVFHNDEFRQFYKIEKSYLKFPSYNGAPAPGEFYDELTKISGERCVGSSEYLWLDYKITKKEKFPFGGLTLKVEPYNLVMPQYETLPIYIELSTYYVLLGHYGPPDYPEFPWSKQFTLSDRYLEEMIKHRLSPYKHYIHPKLHKFKEHVINKGNPSSMVMYYVFGHQPDTMVPSYLQEVESHIQAHGLQEKAMTYLWDEPHEIMDKVINDATLVKENAPSLKIMVTMPYTDKASGLVDVFTPIMEWFDDGVHSKYSDYVGKRYWLYVGCFSHGCGFTNPDGSLNPGHGNGSPDLVIDRPSVYHRSFTWIPYIYNHKPESLLYYNSVECFKLSKPNHDKCYLFTGNSDGTLFGMPKEGDENPVLTLRMKELRRASYDAEYLQLAWNSEPEWIKDKLGKIVQSHSSWSKTYDKYNQLIQSIGERYGK